MTPQENLREKKKKIVAVSGGFDPLHPGHIRMIQEARKLGDSLVVILNNDNWLKKKKGYSFMSEQERAEVLRAIQGVDEVVITSHTLETDDKSVCGELYAIRPDIFVNGGDRTHDNIPEVAVCNEIGCSMVFGIGSGGKIQSSSWLLKQFADVLEDPCFCGSRKEWKRCGMLNTDEHQHYLLAQTSQSS